MNISFESNFLGVMFNSYMNWNTHINYIASKISRTVGILYQLKDILYCIVLYYEALYWRPIRPLSYRHSYGESEIRTQPWLSEGSLTCDLLIAHRRNSITSVLVTTSWMTCLSATCEPWAINLSIIGERITFTMQPVSLEPVTVW